MTQDAVLAPVPGHVPPDAVHDLDIYNIEGLEGGYSEDLHAAWKRVQDSYPAVFWTPRHGGHWVATRFAEIQRLQQDTAVFSNRESFIPLGVIPNLIPVLLDPPEHTPYRKLIMPPFLPKSLKDVTVRARAVAIELIDTLRPQGGCEFVRDFAGAMPIIAFLTMLNLPTEDYAYLRGLAVYMSKPTHPKSPEAWAEMAAYVRKQIDSRRSEPRDDFLTSLVNAKVDGEPVSEQHVFEMCLLLIGGGLDTVVNMTTFAACFLAQNPAHRRELIEHPERLDTAVEEIARRFGTSNLGRLVRQDAELGGRKLAKGDMIVGIFPLAGLDETVNPSPLALDFTREQPRHLNFGSGPHTCVGAVLARREIRIFLEEWLARIPDFQIKTGTRPKVHTGVVNGVSELHLEWPK